MTDLEMWIMILAAVGGAIFSAILGWGDTGGPFEPRKFLSSIGRAVVAGLGIGVGILAVPIEIVNPLIYVLVFLAGMGIDAGGNRLAGIALPKKA